MGGGVLFVNFGIGVEVEKIGAKSAYAWKKLLNCCIVKLLSFYYISYE